MPHIICARGHRTARAAWQEYAADPTCSFIDAGGFCASPTFQDPATVEVGDLVAVLDGRRIVRCIVDSWTRDPDQRAALIDEFGVTHHLLLDSWYAPGQVGPFAMILWHHADAETMRPFLVETLKQIRKGRQEARKAVAQAELERIVPRDAKPSTRGQAAPFDIPWDLYDSAQDCHESSGLSFYLAGKDAYLRQMAWMKRKHNNYYRVLLLNIHHGLGPAKIKKMLKEDPDDPEIVSYSNVKVRLHRGRTKLRERMAHEEAR